MATSKQQRERVTTICQCGCNEVFSAFPVYRPKSEGGGLRVPDYKRGHHPRCRKNQTGQKDAWNKGMSKGDHPSMKRMGFPTGEDHWNYDPEMHPDWFAPDFDFRAFARKFGQKPRSKGGNKAYALFRQAILERDGYTCQHCGMEADPYEEADLLQVHHIVYVKHDPTRIFDPSNVETLCFPCHRRVHRTNK